jgi:hypothetical protein
MKKTFLLLAILFTSFITVNAQSNSDQSFVFAAGVNLGLPVGNFHTGWSFGVGAELQGEYKFNDQFSGVVSGGYSQFFGKSIPFFDTTIKAPNIGLIPILVGVRFYPSTNFFVGMKLGYGLFTNTGSSSGNSGFDYCPQVGYNADQFQVILGYNGVSITGGTLNHLGLSFLYKFNGGK